MLEKKLNAIWYGGSPTPKILKFLSFFFKMLVFIRRGLYKIRILRRQRLSVPVVVVGNLTVGGAGKTPVVLWLVRRLREMNIRVGVVSRGYKARRSKDPIEVLSTTDPHYSGDEPLLVARRGNCPVYVHPNRVKAARALLDEHEVDLILSDDGLQHLGLARDVEIVVIDAQRKFGNGNMLPAGPMREPISRLKSVDFIIVNGGKMQFPKVPCLPMKLIHGNLFELRTGNKASLAEFKGKKVHAVAGIANPRRFFDMLKGAGLELIEHPFPDHHDYELDDLFFDDGIPVLMTEKDSVKCEVIALKDWWFVPVAPMIPAEDAKALLDRINVVVKEFDVEET